MVDVSVTEEDTPFSTDPDSLLAMADTVFVAGVFTLVRADTVAVGFSEVLTDEAENEGRVF